MSRLAIKVDTEGYLFPVSGARYIAPHTGTADFSPRAQDLTLVTVFQISWDEHSILTVDWFKNKIQKYRTDDDGVFDDAFLDTVVLCRLTNTDFELTTDAREYLASLGNQQVFLSSQPDLLPGPYALFGSELRGVWRLTDDFNGTCMVTLKPQAGLTDPFQRFLLESSNNQFLSFALQSRIKARAANNFQLAGLRVIIKDNINLKGIKTSAGNRAFYNTYPPCSESAPCIQLLVEKGVEIVGKSKLSSFGNWEEPIEYVDYQAPWNPRGDGYQSTGGSSSGSAAAIASYDWLDIAIGTDTWASVTRPSLWCGCFGLRPTMGAVSSVGIAPFAQTWDTAGILARDLEKCGNFANQWLAHQVLEDKPKPFTSIIWAMDFWNIINDEQTQKARSFVKSIEKVIGVESIDISFETAWAKYPPKEAQGATLHGFIDEAAPAQCYDAYHNYDDFRTKYQEIFHHAPYTSPRNQATWSYGKSLSKDERDKQFGRIEVFRQWFYDVVLVGKYSNSLIVLPIEPIEPRYRDQPPSFNRPPQAGINALGLAPVLRSPILATPIGEVAYQSRITGREEKLPLVITIIGPPGYDLALIDTVKTSLQHAGLPTVIKTGRSMY